MTATETIEDVTALEEERRSLTERIQKARKAAHKRRERIAEAYRELGRAIVADIYGDTDDETAGQRIEKVAETLADDALLSVVRGQLGLPEPTPGDADDEPREAEDQDDERHMEHMSREEYEEHRDESAEGGEQFPA